MIRCSSRIESVWFIGEFDAYFLGFFYFFLVILEVGGLVREVGFL